jgi:hypothetical protein
MKLRNQFAHLSEQDRQRIFDLCSNHTYEEAVEILQKSRDDGGLNITTSPSALCRFYTSSHPEPHREVLAQYATAIQVRHEQESNAFLGAIRASAESRILESLKNGKALQDLEKEIRLLKTVQNLYLQDSDWRSQHPKAARAAYHAHVERCASAPDVDFIRDDVPNDPGADGALSGDFGEVSDFQTDVWVAKIRAKREREAHDRLATAKAAQRSPSASPDGPPLPPADAAKLPVISHFPLNSTSHHAVSYAAAATYE